MIYHIAQVLIAKATAIISGVSGSQNVGEFDAGILFLDVGAVVAATTLDITIQTSPDGGTTWHQLDTMTQVVAGNANTQRPIKALTDMGELIRASYTIGGGADKSINFGLKFIGKGEY